MSNSKLIDVSVFEKNEAVAEIENLKRQMPYLIEYVTIAARLHRASYEAHKKQGFTDEEALELCKHLSS